MTDSSNQFLKRYFETKVGQGISRSTWYRIKSAMTDNKLGVTIDNVDIVIAIKKQFPGSKISLSNLLTGYLNAIKYSNEKVSKRYTGEQLFRELKSIAGFRCDDSTIVRWFRDVKTVPPGNKFSRTRVYEFKDVYQVYLRAYSYANRYRKSYSERTISRKKLTGQNKAA